MVGPKWRLCSILIFPMVCDVVNTLRGLSAVSRYEMSVIVNEFKT